MTSAPAAPIKLYQFPPAFGLPNASPFCMKMETYLRMAGLPYTLVNTLDLRAAPKGKFPYLVDGETTIADTGFAIDYLKQRYGDPLDAHLSNHERAIALAMRRLFEESYYFCLLYSRWIDEAGWALTREAFFGSLPWPLRALVPPLARRGIRGEIHGQGTGRHTRDEIYAIGCDNLTAVAGFLDDKPFMMGERPTSLDATAYAFLANTLFAPVENKLTSHARSHPNLRAYCERMRARYFT